MYVSRLTIQHWATGWCDSPWGRSLSPAPICHRSPIVLHVGLKPHGLIYVHLDTCIAIILVLLMFQKAHAWGFVYAACDITRRHILTKISSIFCLSWDFCSLFCQHTQILSPQCGVFSDFTSIFIQSSFILQNFRLVFVFKRIHIFMNLFNFY